MSGGITSSVQVVPASFRFKMTFKKGHKINIGRKRIFSDEHKRNIRKSCMKPEARKKRSEAKKGNNNPMKRPEVAEKVSKTLKQTWKEKRFLFKNTPLFKKGQVPWNKGKKGLQIPSEETKQKLSKIMKEIAPFKGRHHSKENKNNHSKFMKEYYKNHSNPKKGTKLSEETIKKIREARAKQILPLKDTSIEVKIQNFLKRLGIEFYTHWYKLSPNNLKLTE